MRHVHTVQTHHLLSCLGGNPGIDANGPWYRFSVVTNTTADADPDANPSPHTNTTADADPDAKAEPECMDHHMLAGSVFSKRLRYFNEEHVNHMVAVDFWWGNYFLGVKCWFGPYGQDDWHKCQERSMCRMVD